MMDIPQSSFSIPHLPNLAVVTAGGGWPDLGRMTYADLHRSVGGTADRLREWGVRPGERVGLYLPNGLETVLLLVALMQVGAVACPVSTRWPPAVALDRLAQVDARRLVAAEALEGNRVQVQRPDALVVRPDKTPDLPSMPCPAVPLDRPWTIVFTSGSSGEPRAALHSVGNHYFSALGSNKNIALAAGDRWLLSLPLYHVGGLAIVMRCLVAGACVAIPEPGQPVGDAIRRLQATHASLVSTQLHRLLEETGGAPVPGLKTVLLGGSAIPSPLIETAHRHGWPIHVSYGSTEMASQTTTTPPGAALDHLLHTAGKLLPYRDLTVAEDGELRVRGRTRFLGYVSGTSLSEPFDADGWFATGDLGQLDPEGYLHVLGRKDRMFISGGENIHPAAIERALRRLPGVRNAVVVPVADPTFGFRPVAFLDGPDHPSPDALIAALEADLPRFMIPRAFLPWPEEATAGMKLDRRRFQKRAEELLAENGE